MEAVERVAREGGLLVCSNHASTVDPPLLPAVLPRSDTWSMAKSEYFARPGLSRWLFTHYHAFPVVRHSADRQALRRAQEILSGGQALILYPEGTRVESGGLRRAEPGAGFLARTASVPVQPVGLVGTRECFPKGARWPRRVPVRVRFGVPFRIRKRRLDGRRIENQEAADSIMLAIADLLPESLRGAYAEVDAKRRAELEDLREPC
jgi:1-acyl-sn-glycerol-3-phosphate acyltransferase